MARHDSEKALYGALIGIAICYLFGAIVAWDMNPGHWSIWWRLWCVAWACVWTPMCAIVADQ